MSSETETPQKRLRAIIEASMDRHPNDLKAALACFTKEVIESPDKDELIASMAEDTFEAFEEIDRRKKIKGATVRRD